MDLFSVVKHPAPRKLKIKTRMLAPGEEPVLAATAGRTMQLANPEEGPSNAQVLNPLPLRSQADVDAFGQPKSIDVNSADISEAESAAREEGDQLEETETPLSRKRKEDTRESTVLSKKSRTEAGGISRQEPFLVDEEIHDSPPFHAEDTSQPKSPPSATHDSHPLELENLATTTVLSPTFAPKWSLPSTSTLSSKADCKEFVDHITPPGRKLMLDAMTDAVLLGEINAVTAHQVTLTSQLQKRFVHHLELVRIVEHRDEEIVSLKDQLAAERARANAAERSANSAREENVRVVAELTRERGLRATEHMEVSWLEKHVSLVKSQLETDLKGLCSDVDAQLALQDEKLRGMNIDFDEELYPQLMSIIAERRWLISRGLRLSAMKALESKPIVDAFGAVVSWALEAGKAQAFEEAEKEKLLTIPARDCSGYDPDAQEEYTAALTALKNLKLESVTTVEKDQDQPISVVMAGLTLPRFQGENAAAQPDIHLKPDVSQLTVPVFAQPRSLLDPFKVEKEVPLKEVLARHVERAAEKRGLKGKAKLTGLGAAHLPRSDGIPVSVPTIHPRDALRLHEFQEARDKNLHPKSPVLQRANSL